jgi:hypothetical protein
MQHCPSALRCALCRTRYHDVDIVSCHPTLMLQVVMKMVAVGAIEWCDALDKLKEYAALDDDGVPAIARGQHGPGCAACVGGV